MTKPIDEIARIPEHDFAALAHYAIFRLATAEFPTDEEGKYLPAAGDQATILVAVIVNAWNMTHETQIGMTPLWEEVGRMRARDSTDYGRMRMVPP